ncbi:MAG TPA: 16S rRNA (guanine(966)-N(2))-methyltransferase RsmD [Acidimicrobiales bacterium]|jgi:16S rRNA (guanine966-N2)-methyltransferase
MRVVGGSARGRALRSPKGDDIRPTSDRVREAVFNMVESRGGVDGATVADLFAGTGALGVEALSRGAEHVAFVDKDRQASDLIKANLDFLGFADRATIVRTDVLRWIAATPKVDVAFADPPYEFDQWPAVLDGLRAELVVLESDRELDLGERWRLLRCKHYGSTVVLVAQLALDTPGDDR